MRALTGGIAVALGAVALAGPATASAQDDPGTYRCRQAAWAAGYSTAKFHLVVGTDGDDAFTADQLVSSARDIVCGFDGDDSIANLKGGDVFLGGEGADSVDTLQDAAFVGGPGADHVGSQIPITTPQLYRAGPFYGGKGADSVGELGSGNFFAGDGADVVDDLSVYYDYDTSPVRFVGGNGADTLNGSRVNPFVGGASFDGGPGNDLVGRNIGTDFDGGSGADRIEVLNYGTMRGGAGDDRIDEMSEGFGDFFGGLGKDSVGLIQDDPTSYADLVFWGEEDDDHVDVLNWGIFNGGAGLDTVDTLGGGIFNQD